MSTRVDRFVFLAVTSQGARTKALGIGQEDSSGVKISWKYAVNTGIFSLVAKTGIGQETY